MRRTLAAVVAGSLLAVSSSIGAAATVPSHAPADTIGGDQLASPGLVVDAGPDAPALPPASQLPASSWLVANLTTGQVLAAKDAHGKFLPASTLKTLTALTLLPKLDPKAKFRATYLDETVDGTRAGLVAGMKYSINTLFTCMLEMSANDAADALAQANGGMKLTVAQMNAAAQRLQAYDTHADTPSGLDGPGETTSAYDLALIAQADFKIPAFRRYLLITHSEVPAPHHKQFEIESHDDLLTNVPYRGIIGGKNGYTVAAQATYVGAATRHGQTIVVALMHAYPIWWPMAAKLLTWGFHANGKVTPVGQLVQPLQPKAAPVSVVSHTNESAIGAPRSHSRNLGPIALVAVLFTIVVATVTGYRRIRPRRYKSRLRLPPIR
jgi:D-alanyl-D-alanine carboxypeptidase (penicillin-binding protein 5/6)